MSLPTTIPTTRAPSGLLVVDPTVAPFVVQVLDTAAQQPAGKVGPLAGAWSLRLTGPGTGTGLVSASASSALVFVRPLLDEGPPATVHGRSTESPAIARELSAAGFALLTGPTALALPLLGGTPSPEAPSEAQRPRGRSLLVAAAIGAIGSIVAAVVVATR